MNNIPIIINNRNRVTSLQTLVSWLLNAGYDNITVLDNDSSYPPLLKYYKQVKNSISILKLGENIGSRALWHHKAEHLAKPPFVYTDSDIVPVEECPTDVIELFLRAASLHPGKKVGFGLKIDDIPRHYLPREMVMHWEGRFWQNPVGEINGVCFYDAPIDTTFAVYTDFRPFYSEAIRSGFPYIARHVPWYANSTQPTLEDLYYTRTANIIHHGWGLAKCHNIFVKDECLNQGIRLPPLAKLLDTCFKLLRVLTRSIQNK